MLIDNQGKLKFNFLLKCIHFACNLYTLFYLCDILDMIMAGGVINERIRIDNANNGIQGAGRKI